MLRNLGVESSAVGVAGLYSDLISDLVMDQRDAELAEAVTTSGIRAWLCDTLMVDQAARERVASQVLAAAALTRSESADPE
jgi:LPPG:FO 2-phospho-L-lactate transferase